MNHQIKGVAKLSKDWHKYSLFVSEDDGSPNDDLPGNIRSPPEFEHTALIGVINCKELTLKIPSSCL